MPLDRARAENSRSPISGLESQLQAQPGATQAIDRFAPPYAYTRVATISTDDHHTSQEFRASVGSQWPFLSDPERLVQAGGPPDLQRLLVLGGRPSFYELWQDLREVTREIRPDWDLATPGLREAWDADDWSRFHGWDKRAARA